LRESILAQYVYQLIYIGTLLFIWIQYDVHLIVRKARRDECDEVQNFVVQETAVKLEIFKYIYLLSVNLLDFNSTECGNIGGHWTIGKWHLFAAR
jgi:hypothetical protein